MLRSQNNFMTKPCIAFMLALTIGGSFRQTTQGVPAGTVVYPRYLDRSMYEAVLDKVFAKEHSGRLFNLFLRFAPSDGTESQIAVRADSDSVVVTEERPENGAAIHAVLDKYVQEHASVSIDEMAKLIRVQRRSVQVSPAEVANWLDGFFSALVAAAPQLAATRQQAQHDGVQKMVMDGTRYSIWFEQGPVDQFELALYFDDINSTGEPGGNLAIANWMNRIRLAVARTK
jgi:hypothetical protein